MRSKDTNAGVRHGAGLAAVAAALLLLAADVSAQGMQRRLREHAGEGTPQRMAPATRPTQFVPDEEARRGGGRMSPDERRQLRRDVQEAGRDLYPERMHRGRRGDMRRE